VKNVARILALLLGPLCVGCASAQSFPNGTVRIILPFSAGGPPDILSRAISGKLSGYWGHPVIIDNRPGANGNIGALAAAKSPPDGYTLFAIYSTFPANHLLFPKLGFDPVKDFAPVTTLAQFPSLIVVRGALPVKSLKELEGVAKSKPGSLNYATIGIGSVQHLGMELFNRIAGASIVHIPYKGLPDVLRSIVAGDTHIGFMGGGGGEFAGLVKSGQLRILAIAGDKRSARYPDAPTFAEAGFPAMRGDNWWAFVAPARTPRPVIDRLNADVVKALHEPEVKQKQIEARGYEVVADTPEQLATRIRETLEVLGPVITGANIRAE
jgi:tripartite-type tricarboxylate transporter receptor subunit TctC